VTAAIAIIAGLFAAIFFHEAAHFAAAKAFDMKVTEFFAGFGPRLWSFRRGETEYGVKALVPLGGYVKITGMNPVEEIDPAEEHRTYRGKPFWQKSIVVLAGVMANFVLAFILIYLVLTVVGTQEVRIEARVGEVIAELDNGDPTPASQAGLQAGDLIRAVDGVAVGSWGDLLDAIKGQAFQPLQLDFESNGELRSTVLTPVEITDESGTRGFVGIGRPDPVSITTVRSGPISGVVDAAQVYGDTVALSVRGIGTILWPPNLLNLFGDAVEGRDPGLERPVTPIGLVEAGSDIFDASGWAGVLFVIAGLNIIVALFNVLPLFPLDGGHFAVALYEKLRGRPVDIEKLMPLAVGVIMFFMSLFLLGLWFDIFGPSLDLG
jgi:membrane-associated protease RseP (regulator of RpoE activity)